MNGITSAKRYFDSEQNQIITLVKKVFSTSTGQAHYSRYIKIVLTTDVINKKYSDIVIDWGDGKKEYYSKQSSKTVSHWYDYPTSEDKLYTIKIQGNIKSIATNNIDQITPSKPGLKEDGTQEYFAKNYRVHNIISADFSNCNKISSINLASSQLEKINVDNCVMLTALDVSSYESGNISDVFSRNFLTKLDVSSCVSLKNLRIFGNKITNLDVKNCVELEVLEIGNLRNSKTDLTHVSYKILSNSIETLDLTKNTKLKKVNLFGLLQNNIDLSKNTELEELYTNNALASLDISKNTKLTYLFIANNSKDLTELDVSKNTELQYLSLGCDNDYNIGGDYALMSNIPILNLDVSKNKKLIRLHTNNVQLENVIFTDKDIENDTNESITHVYLNCPYNMKNIDLTKLPNLKVFQLKVPYLYNPYIKNYLSTIEEIDFSKNVNLQTLNLNGSKYLKRIDLSNNVNLTSLSFSYNYALEYIDITKCTLLQNLYFSNHYSPITTFDLSKNINLKLIESNNTSLNKITEEQKMFFDFTKCTLVTSISFRSSNRFKYIDITGLSNLSTFIATGSTNLKCLYGSIIDEMLLENENLFNDNTILETLTALDLNTHTNLFKSTISITGTKIPGKILGLDGYTGSIGHVELNDNSNIVGDYDFSNSTFTGVYSFLTFKTRGNVKIKNVFDYSLKWNANHVNKTPNCYRITANNYEVVFSDGTITTTRDDFYRKYCELITANYNDETQSKKLVDYFQLTQLGPIFTKNESRDRYDICKTLLYDCGLQSSWQNDHHGSGTWTRLNCLATPTISTAVIATTTTATRYCRILFKMSAEFFVTKNYGGYYAWDAYKQRILYTDKQVYPTQLNSAPASDKMYYSLNTKKSQSTANIENYSDEDNFNMELIVKLKEYPNVNTGYNYNLALFEKPYPEEDNPYISKILEFNYFNSNNLAKYGYKDTGSAIEYIGDPNDLWDLTAEN